MALTQVSTGGIKDGQVHTADLADSQITAAKLHADALDHTYTLGASGTDHYTFTGEGLTGAVNDPTLYLTRGKTYRFVNGNSSGAHPFRIQSVAGAGGTEYNTGVTNNAGAGGSTIIFEVPHDAPDVLYYICTSHATMNGIFYVTGGGVTDGSVTTAKIAADAVTGAKIADDTIDSEHFAADSIDSEHFSAGSVDSTAVANDAITSAKIADNPSFSGTSGITLPVGTTAQRPTANAGILRFNSTTGEVEISDGTLFRRITNPPEVSSISPSLATNSEATITVTGAGFANGDIVKFINSSTAAEVAASATSFTNSTTLVATATITTDGTYKVQVVKADGTTGQSATALLTVSDAPTWSTSSGALTAGTSGTSYSLTLSASSDSAVTFALQSGSLPSGLSLSSAGVLSGTPDATSATNYSFTIRATDAESQTADRAFTLQINVSRTLNFILHGAGGQDASPTYSGSESAGHGGVVQATMTFMTGTVLYIAVDQGSGTNGSDTHGGYTGASGKRAGGYAGVFLTSIAHGNAQLIAGGGGSNSGFGQHGGDGGADTGESATGSYAGGGGSQSSGGSGGGNGSGGSALQGGNGGSGDDCGGAGGGGYYGGGGGQGAGSGHVGSGGGGSNYVIGSGTSNVTNQRGGGGGNGQAGKVEIQDTSGNQLYIRNTSGTATYTVV